VSYNTYPGWHTLNIIREMMLYRTRDIDDPIEKSRHAREWVSFVTDALSDSPDSAYAVILHNYLNYRVTQKPELDHAALLHDELEAYNVPIYFYQFAERAEQHGLQYLVEADFPTVMPTGFKDEVVEYLGETARTTIEMEQYLDFLRNRTFRRTLLCHDTVPMSRRLAIEPIREFYAASSALPVTSDDDAARGVERFAASDGITFATDHPVTNAAFHYLGEIAPGAVRFDDLFHAACARLNMTQPDNRDAAALAANLLRAFSSSMELVEFHIYAPPIVTQISDHPTTQPLIRFQAGQGTLVASLLHRRVELDSLTRLVLLNLDGQNDRAALLEFLGRLAEEGKIGVRDANDQPAQSPEAARTILARELDNVLQWLAKSALLIG
jgi:methyltransferase-like protein